MLRVGASGEGPFTSGTQTFSMDKRKKQVSLCETAPAATAPEDRKVGVAAPKMFAFDAIFSQDDAQVSDDEAVIVLWHPSTYALKSLSETTPSC